MVARNETPELTPEQDLRIRFILSKTVNHQLAKENARLRERVERLEETARSYESAVEGLVKQRMGFFGVKEN